MPPPSLPPRPSPSIYLLFGGVPPRCPRPLDLICRQRLEGGGRLWVGEGRGGSKVKGEGVKGQRSGGIQGGKWGFKCDPKRGARGLK